MSLGNGPAQSELDAIWEKLKLIWSTPPGSAHVDDTVTLRSDRPQLVDDQHPLTVLRGWKVGGIKVDAQQRPLQIFLEKEGVACSMCVSPWVAKDGTIFLYLRGAS